MEGEQRRRDECKGSYHETNTHSMWRRSVSVGFAQPRMVDVLRSERIVSLVTGSTLTPAEEVEAELCNWPKSHYATFRVWMVMIS